jgi:hypothetical protein
VNRSTNARSSRDARSGATSREANADACWRSVCPSALQRAADGFFSCVDHLRDFLRMEAKHISQNVDGPLAGRQHLQGCDKRESDGLRCLVVRLRPRRSIGEPINERIRIRFQPQHLTEAFRPRKLGRLHLDYTFHSRTGTTRAQDVQAAAGGHAIEPGAYRGPALERTQSAPGRDQRLLESILRIVKRAEHPIAMQVQFVTMPIDELAKGCLVSRLGALDRVW